MVCCASGVPGTSLGGGLAVDRRDSSGTLVKLPNEDSEPVLGLLKLGSGPGGSNPWLRGRSPSAMANKLWMEGIPYDLDSFEAKNVLPGAG